MISGKFGNLYAGELAASQAVHKKKAPAKQMPVRWCLGRGTYSDFTLYEATLQV